jgi:hypothetical protein
MVLFPFVASVVTPVIIPFKKPVKSDVVPDPARAVFVSAVVTPKPIVAPAFEGLVVAIPIV